MQGEIDDLRDKATAAGYEYHLYDLSMLLAEIQDENLKESLRRAKRYLPKSMFGSMLSDFFRYWCLQDGGVYMDTDVLITTDTFPALPDADGVFTCSEQTARNNLNTCVTVCNGDKGRIYARFFTELATDRLKKTWLDSFEQCRANAAWLIEHRWSLISYIGPAFVRHYLPHLFGATGVTVQRMPYELCSSHDPRSAIFHFGDGSWCNGGKGNDKAQRKTGIFGK